MTLSYLRFGSFFIIFSALSLLAVNILHAQVAPAGEADPDLERRQMQNILQKNKPNILYIMLDDAAYEDFTTREVVRPNIDAFKQESMFFDHFYTAPMCSPTRTSLMSGQYQSRFGLQWVYGPRSIRGIEPTQTTLIDALNSAGYITAHVGKWHAGAGDGYEVWDHNYEKVVTAGGVVTRGYADPEIFYTENTSVKFKGAHRTDVFADHVIDFIESSRTESRPFYVNYWLNAPHSPHQPSAEWRSLYSADDPYGNYKGLFSQADYNIGKIIDYIDSDPWLKQNTIVIVTSDNGGTEKTRDKNGDFRGYKTDVFEGGTRLPLYIRWPNRIPVGENSSVISVVDLMPTILDFAGAVKPRGLDGESFASKVYNEREKDRSKPLYWMHKVSSDLKDEEKLNARNTQLSWAVRDGDWKVVYEPLDEDHIMLFNVVTDPGENNDVSSLYPSTVKALHRSYLDWKVETTELDMQPVRSAPQESYELTGDEEVVFEYETLQNTTNMDFTFVASIIPKGGDGVERVIAQKKGAWEFKINEENQLELIQYDDKSGKMDVVQGRKITLQDGVRYDVAFSISGMKTVSNFVRFFVRESGSSVFVPGGGGKGVRSVAYNDKPIQLGSDTNSFIGIINKPRMFVAPFDESDLTSVYESPNTSASSGVLDMNTLITETGEGEDSVPVVDPVPYSVSPMVDLKMYLYKEQEYFDQPRDMVAIRRAKFKWDTAGMSDCELKLEYKNGQENIDVSTAGVITVDRVKSDNIQGLDRATLKCEVDGSNDIISDEVNVNLFDKSKRKYRLFVNDEEMKLKRRVVREKALSLCLTDAAEYQQSNVMCTFGQKVIYAHGDTPALKGDKIDVDDEVYEVDSDSDIYGSGNEAALDGVVSTSDGGRHFSSTIVVNPSTQMANAWMAFWSAFKTLFSY